VKPRGVTKKDVGLRRPGDERGEPPRAEGFRAPGRPGPSDGERENTVGPIQSTVGARNVPESVRALGSLTAIDYADLFTLTTTTEATPERWARAMFGNVPSLGELLIWRGVLGLRLARGRSPATVGGWRIGGRGADWIRLEAASASLSCNLLVQTGEGRVSLVTFLHYDRRLGRVVWPPLSGIHRRLVPGVLRGGATRAARLWPVTG
jgi:hypothetical protein